jgi:hypothetical protein
MESEQKFGTKKTVRGGSRKAFVDEIHNLNFSPNVTVGNKSRRKRLGEHTACMCKMRNTYRILIQ